ncbi:hypothetical protein [Actinomyces procaprae]|uniref:hypothetical protein n=1 Tax=Actinomyces procaprae TaxID=2560010 RepID=UPI001444D496|nr:hypothetical protein [Actinomyces procaprae]
MPSVVVADTPVGVYGTSYCRAATVTDRVTFGAPPFQIGPSDAEKLRVTVDP